MCILKVILPVPILLLCLLISGVHANMSSANYRITSTVISGGGGMLSSASYVLMSTVGQESTSGNSSSASYSIDSGFWYTILLNTIGDVNGDGDVNLEDVIATLQVVTGQSPDSIMKEADVDGDGHIGLGEAIMILRKLGGL